MMHHILIMLLWDYFVIWLFWLLLWLNCLLVLVDTYFKAKYKNDFRLQEENPETTYSTFLIHVAFCFSDKTSDLLFNIHIQLDSNDKMF